MLYLKHRKRRFYIALITVLTLLATIFPVATFADNEAIVSVGAPEGQVPEEGYSPGETFTVPITIANNPGFAAAGFHLSYDETALDITDIKYGGDMIFDSAGMQNPEGGNIGYFALSDNTSNGVLVRVEFLVLDGATGGDYEIGIDLLDGVALNFANYELQAVPVQFVPGSVTLAAAPGPDPATIGLGAVSGRIEAGDPFTVPVSIADNPGFAGAAFVLGYDHDALEVTDVSADDGLFGDSLLWNSELDPDGVGYLDMVSLSSVEGDGKLFEISFKAKDEAEPDIYPISLSLKNNENDFVNDQGDPIPVVFVDSSVTVSPPLPAGTAIVSVGADENYPGHDVVVPVSIEKNPGFATGIFTVDLGDAPVTLTGLDFDGALLSEGSVEYDFEQNLNVGFVSASANITADGVLFNLLLTIDEDAEPDEYAISVGLMDNKDVNFTAHPVGDGLPIKVPVVFEAGSVTALPQRTPTVDDLDFDLTTVTYNGLSHAVTVEPKGEAVGLLGAITVYYENADYPKSTTAPTDAGAYAVTVDIANAEIYAGAEGIALGTLTIAKAAAPTLAWPTAGDLVEGDALSASELTGGSTVYGSFAWTDGTTVPAVTGSYGVTFTPNAATVKNYEAITPTTKDIGVTVLKKGDLDGDDYLSSFDVLMVARVVMGYDAMPTGAAFALADVDGDTVITMADVLLLMRKAMGLI